MSGRVALVTGAATGIGKAVAYALAADGCRVVINHLGSAVPADAVVTVSSSTTGLMLPGYAVYEATKGAVEQFTRILSKDFGRRGITVNAVAPGATETESYRTGKSAEFLAGLEAMSAFGRPDEIAAVVAFLAGDAGRWITAQVIRVNGGTV